MTNRMTKHRLWHRGVSHEMRCRQACENMWRTGCRPQWKLPADALRYHLHAWNSNKQGICLCWAQLPAASMWIRAYADVLNTHLQWRHHGQHPHQIPHPVLNHSFTYSASSLLTVFECKCPHTWHVCRRDLPSVQHRIQDKRRAFQQLCACSCLV